MSRLTDVDLTDIVNVPNAWVYTPEQMQSLARELLLARAVIAEARKADMFEPVGALLIAFNENALSKKLKAYDVEDA